nr:FxsA family protein [Kineococcus siccus]
MLVVEVWLLVQLADLVGTLGVAALLAVETLAGIAVLRRAGRRALDALRRTGWVQSGSPAGRRSAEGVGDALLTGAGGALLVLPGLLSDLLAVLCLLPPTRALLRRVGARWLRRRVEAAVRQAQGATVTGSVVRDGAVDEDVVDGEVVDDDGDRPQLGRGPVR